MGIVAMSHPLLGSPSMDPETTILASVSEKSSVPPLRCAAYPASAAATITAAMIWTIVLWDMARDKPDPSFCCGSGPLKPTVG